MKNFKIVLGIIALIVGLVGAVLTIWQTTALWQALVAFIVYAGVVGAAGSWIYINKENEAV